MAAMNYTIVAGNNEEYLTKIIHVTNEELTRENVWKHVYKAFLDFDKEHDPDAMTVGEIDAFYDTSSLTVHAVFSGHQHGLNWNV